MPNAGKLRHIYNWLVCIAVGKVLVLLPSTHTHKINKREPIKHTKSIREPKNVAVVSELLSKEALTAQSRKY